MQQEIKDENLKRILDQLSAFSFQFHGYDESGIPLVVAPNGQIVEINIAVRFANEQMEKQKTQTSGGPEDMPESMPNVASASPESSVETSMEEESSIETAKEDKVEKADNQNTGSDLQVPQTAPAVQIKQPELIKPYGAGFDPKSFNPSSKASVTSFVDKNITSKSSKSNKWLAVMFKKFLEENKLD